MRGGGSVWAGSRREWGRVEVVCVCACECVCVCVCVCVRRVSYRGTWEMESVE